MNKLIAALVAVLLSVSSFGQMPTPVGPSGFTTLRTPLDARLVYVSSSAGNDSNPGTQGLPKRSLASAKQLLRPGYPDRLLLRSGDTWQEQIRGWDVSGRSAQEPAVITRYGPGPRPVLNTGVESGLLVWGAEPLNYLAVIGIEFVGSGDAGIDWTRPGNGLLLEDLRIHGYKNNVVIQGFPGERLNTSIRRCILFDPSRTDVFNGSTNIYMAQYHGVLIEECLLDQTPENEAAGHVLSHHLYLGENNPPANHVRNNMARNGGRTNFNIRSGGEIIGNLSQRGAQGITVGISYAQAWTWCAIQNNVITESRNEQSGQNLGFGITLEKVYAAFIDGNLITNGTDGRDHKALVIQSTCSNIYFTHNVIRDWQSPDPWGWDTVKITGVPAGPVVIAGNQLQQHSASSLVTFENSTRPPQVQLHGNIYWSLWTSPWCHSLTQGYNPLALDPSGLIADLGTPPRKSVADLGDVWGIGRARPPGVWYPAYGAERICAYLRAP
jgi:hypothetical protein